jgi:hypothetical protein
LPRTSPATFQVRTVTSTAIGTNHQDQCGSPPRRSGRGEPSGGAGAPGESRGAPGPRSGTQPSSQKLRGRNTSQAALRRRRGTPQLESRSESGVEEHEQSTATVRSLPRPSGQKSSQGPSTSSQNVPSERGRRSHGTWREGLSQRPRHLVDAQGEVDRIPGRHPRWVGLVGRGAPVHGADLQGDRHGPRAEPARRQRKRRPPRGLAPIDGERVHRGAGTERQKQRPEEERPQ